jgi:hypothetical protein
MEELITSMKFIFCTNCQDIFKLDIDTIRHCKCGAASGKYIDEIYAEYAGKTAIPIGLGDASFSGAILAQPEHKGPGKEFKAFVIPKECSTFIRKDKLD